MKRNTMRLKKVVALLLICALLAGCGAGNKPVTEAETAPPQTTMTEAPTTEAPTTEAPTTEAPTTEAPATASQSTEVGSTTVTKKEWMTEPKADYTAVIEHRNRTANSVEIRVTLTLKFQKSGSYDSYGQRFEASVGSASSGTVIICAPGGWKKGGSVSKTSNWFTVPLNTTGATTISVKIYNWQVNSAGTSKGSSCTSTYDVNVPANK